MTKTTSRSRRLISEAISRLAIIQTERMAPASAFIAAAKSILRQEFAAQASKPASKRRTAKPKSVQFAASTKPVQTSGALAEPDDADDLVILPSAPQDGTSKLFVPSVMTQPDIEADPSDKEGSSAAFVRALV